MIDSHDVIKAFVKIVERYPVIYDCNSDKYRSRRTELTWEELAGVVRKELNQECTVEELKAKWKGLRSSFTRYRNKISGRSSGDNTHTKKYYLYDHLKFLEPFTKTRGTYESESFDIPEFNVNYTEEDPINSENSNNGNWEMLNIKPEVDIGAPTYSNEESGPQKRLKVERDTDEENEDLQFFKSLLPDIKYFTKKEKRKMKMKILEIIDEIDSARGDTVDVGK